MAYSTQDDILLQLDSTTLIQLTDDDGSGVVDSDVVDRAIADADEEIDAYIGVVADLPLSTTPSLIRKISVDLAICNLYVRRDDTIPDVRKSVCDNARKMLDKIARGLMVLGILGTPVADPGGPAASYPKSDRVFTVGRGSDSSSGSLDNY